MKTKKNSSFFAYSFLSIALGLTFTVTILSVILPFIFSINRADMPTWFDLIATG